MYRKISGLSVLKLFLYSIMLFLGGMVMPIFFAFIPALFLSEMRRQGVLPVAGVFLGVCVILGFLTDPMTALSLMTIMGPLILILDYCMRTDKSVDFTMAVGTILFIVSFGFMLYRSGTLQMIQTGKFLTYVENIQQEVIKNAGLSSMEQARIGLQLKTFMSRAISLVPAFIVLSGLLMTYVSYRISGRNMRIAGDKVVCPGPFFLLRLPRAAMIPSAALVAIGYGLAQTVAPGIELYVLNLGAIVATLFAFQGLAIENFFLLRYVRQPIARGLILFLTLTIPVGQMALAALGLLDQVLNIRNIQGA